MQLFLSTTLHRPQYQHDCQRALWYACGHRKCHPEYHVCAFFCLLDQYYPHTPTSAFNGDKNLNIFWGGHNVGFCFISTYPTHFFCSPWTPRFPSPYASHRHFLASHLLTTLSHPCQGKNVLVSPTDAFVFVLLVFLQPSTYHFLMPMLTMEILSAYPASFLRFRIGLRRWGAINSSLF